MKTLKKAFLAGAVLLAFCALAAALWITSVLSNLPDVASLKRYRPAAATEALDRNGAVLAHFYDRSLRVWVPITSLPEDVIMAVVIAEDDTFFGHKGVNYQAVWEALKHDVRKKRFARGGSTITQQMIKNVLLSKEKTIARKLREFVLARRAEEVLTKRQILEIYLNEVEWGDQIYGVEAAGRFYFDKHAGELTRAEAALLAGMLPNPRYYDPYKRPEKARQRQEQVLFNLFQAKYMTDAEYAEALHAPLLLRDPSSRRFDLPQPAARNGRSCHQKVLEQVLLREFGDGPLYRQGMRIRTTLDKSLQESVAAMSGPPDTVPAAVPERLLAVKEGGEVRALACTEDDEVIGAYLATLGTPFPAYELVAITVEDITAAEIIIPEAPVVPQAADAVR